jgi:hypothetical protein
VPAEFLGLARQFRAAVLAEDQQADITLAQLEAPLCERYDGNAKGTLQRAAHIYRSGAAGHVGLDARFVKNCTLSRKLNEIRGFQIRRECVPTHFRAVQAFTNLFQNRAERQLVSGMLIVRHLFGQPLPDGRMVTDGMFATAVAAAPYLHPKLNSAQRRGEQ